MKWLLALDMGTNSLGWWAYKLKKDGTVDSSLDGGVRLFPDSREPAKPGRVGDSLAVNRRVERGLRRNRAAKHWRLEKLVNFLIDHDLLPGAKTERDQLFQTPSKKSALAPDSTNPYFLRAEAVEKPLDRYLLGRALVHLAKRRGFKSNRKDNSGEDKKAEKEAGEIKAGISVLKTQLEDQNQTLGQYLWTQYQQEKNRATNGPLDGRPRPIRFKDGNKFFADRAMYADEFDRIRARQAPHLDLSDPDWEEIRFYLLDQRPLRPVERGFCQFFHDKPRHWTDTPVAHSYRIYQDLNNLNVIDHNQNRHPLTNEQRQAILEKLESSKEVSFKGLRKLKDTAGNPLFPDDSQFSHEDEKRKKLKGHKLKVDFAKNPILSPLWDQLSQKGLLDDLFEKLHEDEENHLIRCLTAAPFDATPEQARACAKLKLASGTTKLSLKVDFEKNSTLRPLWNQLSQKGLLDDLFEKLHEDEENHLIHCLTAAPFDVTPEQARACAELKLASGTTKLSRKAMEQLTLSMKTQRDEDGQPLKYDAAVRLLHDGNGELIAAHHSKKDRQQYDKLPYYGQVMPERMLGGKGDKYDPYDKPEQHYGKINNPTVHVALNQLRLLVNTLCDRFGSAPYKIHIEVTRELKQPKKQREETAKEQAKNQKENERIKEMIESLGHHNPSMKDIKKYKLWKELRKDQCHCLCPFSGRQISAAQLFNGDVEIEHILPFSRTLDDSMANKTVAFREANRLKGNSTPYEAFGQDQHPGQAWEEITKRIRVLPKNKQWRFGPEAMKRYESENGDFIARQLNDTAYMTRVACDYLQALGGVEDVVALPGRLTALIRGKWHLNNALSDHNKKNRDDHRHHALDAAIIGLTNRSLLKKISTASRRGADDLVDIQVPPLEENLNKAIRERIREIHPSWKPNHSLHGKIFEDTAYGFVKVRDEQGKEVEKLAVREKMDKNLSDSKIKQIADPKIKKALQERLAGTDKISAKAREEIIVAFAREHGIKTIRLHQHNDSGSAIRIKSEPYKAYKIDSYVCCDIWRLPPKSKGKDFKYQGKFWRYSDVSDDRGKLHLPKDAGKPHPAAKFITRLFKNDLIEIGAFGKGDMWRVAGFKGDGRLDIRVPYLNEKEQNRHSINVLAPKGIRRLHVTVDGRILRNPKKKSS